MSSAVFGILGAMVGAGFASGREIAAFFSQWGAWSWLLALVSALAMTGLMGTVLNLAEGIGGLLPHGKGRWAGQVILGLLYGVTAGGMTAAAGELAALVIPVRYARPLGALGTLLMGLAMSVKPLKAGAILGRVLTPVMLLALILCLRLPETRTAAEQDYSLPRVFFAFCKALAYAGLNVMLSAGMISGAGQGKNGKEKRMIALAAGSAVFLLLALANGALLRREDAIREKLPVVALLRNYGKMGYYLSAALLYLAVATTLLALLRGLRDVIGQRWKGKRTVWLAGLTAAGFSLAGFEGIVSAAYPILGFVSLAVILTKRWAGKN